jgi:hypothetical protein
MANAKAGSFTLNTADTSTQQITGVGFTPKAVIFWAQQISGSPAELRTSFGVGVSSTVNWSTSTSYHGTSSPGQDHQFLSDSCFHWNDALSDAALAKFKISAMDADGFTLSVALGEASVTVNYLAIGGSDVSVKAGTFDSTTTTNGTNTVGSIGFNPKALLTCVGPLDNTEGVAGTAGINIGLAVGSSVASMAENIFSNNGAATQAHTQLLTSRLISTLDGNGATATKATVALGTNQFAVTWDIPPPASTRVGYLALGGTASYDLTVLTKPTSGAPVAQSKSGLAWQPVGLFLMSRGEAANVNPVANIKWSLGAASSTSDRVATGWYEPNSTLASNVPIGTQMTTRALVVQSATAGTTASEADLSSLNTDGYTLNWSKVDAIAAEVAVLSFGAVNPNFSNAPMSMATTITAALTTAIQMAAAVQCAASVNATLTTQSGLRANVAMATAITAALTVNPRLFSNLSMATTLTAALSTSIQMRAAVGAGTLIVADLKTIPGGLSAAIKMACTVRPSLDTEIDLIAAVKMVSAMTAALTTATPMAAAVQVTPTVTATLQAPSDLTGVLPFGTWLDRPTGRNPVILAEVTVNVGGVEVTRYLSNRPYATGPFDTPASTGFEAVITGGVKTSEKLNLDGNARMSFGDIELANTDGAFDGWLLDLWANRKVKVYFGDETWPRYKFVQIFDGVVTDIDSKARDKINIKFRDKLELLNSPLTDAKLGGTTADKDRLLPLCFGEVHNITPILVDAANHVYQVHRGAVFDIIEVRDNEVPITVNKFLDRGMFQLTAAPSGTITCSVQGAVFADGHYYNDVGNLIRRIVQEYGTVVSQRYTAADIDAASFDAFVAAHTAPVGLFVSDNMTVLDCCNKLAQSLQAQVLQTRQGLLQLQQVNLFNLLPSDTITAADIYDRTLVISERPAVAASVQLGFCKNWTVQNDIVTEVVEEHRALFAEEWLTTTVWAPWVSAAYRLDVQPTMVETLLITRLDAQNEATRRLNIVSTPRHTYTAAGVARLLQLKLGQAVTLQHQRFNLAAGKVGMVVSLDPDWATGRTTVGVMVAETTPPAVIVPTNPAPTIS